MNKKYDIKHREKGKMAFSFEASLVIKWLKILSKKRGLAVRPFRRKKKEEEKTEGRENTGIESIVYLTKN